MVSALPPLNAEQAESLRDAWRAVRDVMQGQPTDIGTDCGHQLRVGRALAAIAAKLLCDNVAMTNYADQRDPAVLAEAIACAERETLSAELDMVAAGIQPPGNGQAPVSHPG